MKQMTNHPNRSRIKVHVDFGRPAVSDHRDTVIAGGYAVARALLVELRERGLTGPVYAVARDRTLGSAFSGYLTLVCGGEVADIEYDWDDYRAAGAPGFVAELRKSDWRPLPDDRAKQLAGVLSPVEYV